jgi:hypothetical protein
MRDLPRSKWANPFRLRIGATDSERKECLRRYKAYVLSRKDLIASLHELRGKTLACWCSPKACHGHVLKELYEEFVGGQ